MQSFLFRIIQNEKKNGKIKYECRLSDCVSLYNTFQMKTRQQTTEAKTKKNNNLCDYCTWPCTRTLMTLVDEDETRCALNLNNSNNKPKKLLVVFQCAIAYFFFILLKSQQSSETPTITKNKLESMQTDCY